MAATFIPDTVEGTQFDVQLGAPTGVRGGLVTGISGDPSTSIDQVIAAVAARGYPLGKAAAVSGAPVFLQRIAGNAVGTDSFRVQLWFTNQTGFAPTAYVITTRSYMQAYQTNRIPGKLQPLLVPAWTDPARPTNPPVPADLATVTFQYPMREITVSGVKIGMPPDDSQYAGKIGSANQEQFLGLPMAYWVVSNAGTTDSLYTGYYSYNVSAITKTIEDWSSYHTLYNAKVNTYVKVAAGDEDDVRNAPYKHGIIKGAPGLLRVGPYPVTSYQALFGFTTSPGGGDPKLNKLTPNPS